MAGLSFTIHAVPSLSFYSNTKIDSVDLCWKRLISISDIRSELSISGSVETPSVSISLDNGDGALTQWISDLAPLSQAEIFIDGSSTMMGQITQVTISNTITLQVEA